MENHGYKEKMNKIIRKCNLPTNSVKMFSINIEELISQNLKNKNLLNDITYIMYIKNILKNKI